MAGIFQAIKGMPLTKDVKNKPAVKPDPDDIDQVITRWQKAKDPQDTKKILQYIKPTIQSSLHTYAPGQQGGLKIKATSYALQSLGTYQPGKSSPKTYVFNALQRLNRIRRQRQNIIHIPQNQVYVKQAIQAKTAQLEQDLGRQPTDQQLSDKMGISIRKLNKLRSSIPGMTLNESSTLNQQGRQTLGGADLTDRDYFQYVYSSVGPIDKKIMQWSTGFDRPAISNNQIAKKLNLSAGAVSQRKARIQQLLGQVRGVL